MSDSNQEIIRWRINKVEAAVNSKIQNLEAERLQFRSRADLVEDVYTTWIRAVLAAVSFLVPLLLTLYAVSLNPNASTVFGLSKNLLQVYAPTFFIWAIIIGLIAFILLIYLKAKIHRSILSLDASYLSAISKLNFFREYFNFETYYLERLNERRIASFFNYANFAAMAVKVDLISPLRNMSNSKFFRNMRIELQERLENAEETMRQGLQDFDSANGRISWENDGIDLRHLLYVQEDFLKHHGR